MLVVFGQALHQHGVLASYIRALQVVQPASQLLIMPLESDCESRDTGGFAVRTG